MLYAPDGLEFAEAGPVNVNIRDNGVFCPEALQDIADGPGITWGLALKRDEAYRPHLVRFDYDLTPAHAGA